MAICVEVEGTSVQTVWVGVHVCRGAEVVIHPVGLLVERARVVHPLEDEAGGFREMGMS